MKTLFKNYSLPDNLDVLFLLVFGILLQMTDGSPFTLKERWMIVWETELPLEYFSLFMQKIIKTVLSIIVAIRCVTTYAYVVSAMLVIFCLLKHSAPKLMLLWLLIAGLKSVLLTFVEALTGVYVCSAFGKIRKACIEFVVSKALEIIFAAYLWGSVLNIYQEIERKSENTKKTEIWEHWFLQKREFGHHRARSLLDESALYKTACLNTFEYKDVPQIILQMLRRGDEMSSDSLLSRGMMLASVSNMGSFDNLKASLSLGELGFIDLRSAQVSGLEDDETLSPQEKALKFLGLTWNDVREAQRNKTVLGSDIYKIDKKTWEQVINGGTFIRKPKRARGEVFVHELQQAELEEESRKSPKKPFDFKFSWSFFNLYAQKEISSQETDDDQFEEEEEGFREEDEEEKEDGQPTSLFMSNIKEEVMVNRIRLNFVSKKWKGNAYAELYKQDYMSVIGPEVFDKASKLRQLTFLNDITNYNETVTSMSLPTFEDATKDQNNDFEEKIYDISSVELNLNDSERTNAKCSEGKANFAKEMKSEPDEKTKAKEDKCLTEKLLMDYDGAETQSKKNFKDFTLEFQYDCHELKVNEKSENINSATSIVLNPEFTDLNEQLPPCYRRRRIIIKRIGKQTAGIVSPKCQNFFKNSKIHTNEQSESKSSPCQRNGQEKFESKKNLEILFPNSKETSNKRSCDSGKSVMASRNEQMHFHAEILHKPLLDVLMSYDLKKTIYVRQNSKMKGRNENEKFSKLDKKYNVKRYDGIKSHERESKEKQKRIWKSEVLKTVEACRRKYSQMNSLEHKFEMKKLLKCFLEKFNFPEMGEERLVSLWIANDVKCKHCSNYALLGLEEKVEFPEEENFSQSNDDFSLEPSKEQIIRCSSFESFPGTQITEEVSLEINNDIEISDYNILKSDFENVRLENENDCPVDVPVISDMASGSHMLEGPPEDEPISLYYSKAANLASPLLDMERFIYPDHIHYSYKHVKKKGFDVDINGGFPLLVPENLTMTTPTYDSESTRPEFAIVRRPMDLSFAKTTAFADWQNSDQTETDSGLSNTKNTKSRPKIDENKEQKLFDVAKNKKMKKGKFSKRSTNDNGSHSSMKPESTNIETKHCPSRNFSDIKHMYSTKDYLLIEKLLKMHWELNKTECAKFKNSGRERTPVQISSTQLHSNKGRINSTYNPAIFLQENKNRSEKKKKESQEDRTKDMFARLEGEALLHSKNIYKPPGHFHRT